MEAERIFRFFVFTNKWWFVNTKLYKLTITFTNTHHETFSRNKKKVEQNWWLEEIIIIYFSFILTHRRPTTTTTVFTRTWDFISTKHIKCKYKLYATKFIIIIFTKLNVFIFTNRTQHRQKNIIKQLQKKNLNLNNLQRMKWKKHTHTQKPVKDEW